MFRSYFVPHVLCLLGLFYYDVVVGVNESKTCSVAPDFKNAALDNVTVVNTFSGPVQGVKVENGNDDFFAFFSIPYAKPPIGDLRFKAPLPVDSWETIPNKGGEGPACIQISDGNTSEDCLTLNIYTKDPNLSGKPVYVYIHGGFLSGGSASFNTWGPHLFMEKDIVVVVVQFRLVMLGFLNLGMEEAPGNMALLDVIEALKWIKSNIELFGGDPNEITIGGQSSGGVMTHALALSPLAKGLFKRVIIESGTTLSYRMFTHDTMLSIVQTKEELNMVNSTNTELLEYLKHASTDELLQISANISARYPNGYAIYDAYTLSVDYLGVVPKNPIELVRDNNYRNVPMLIGVNSDEGNRLETSIQYVDYVNQHFEMVVPTDLYPIDDKSIGKSKTASAIKSFYFPEGELNTSTVSNLFKLCTDSWYGHITDYLIRLQSCVNYTAPIYYYMFAVDGAYNINKILEGIQSPGPSHSDENGYLWISDQVRDIVANDNYSDLTRRRMITMWSNFVKTGNPTPEITDEIPLKWETLNYPRMNYFLINETLSIQQNPWRERLLFWQRLYGYDEI